MLTFANMIVTNDPYLVLMDRRSPYNHPDSIVELLQAAKQACSDEPDLTLWNFNQRLMDLGTANELVSWSFLFGGVFKVVLQVSSSKLDHELPSDFEWEQIFAVGRLEAMIRCPSGQLLLTDMKPPGLVATPFATITPGDYRVRVAVNGTAVNGHSFLEAINEYPNSEGPDWVIRLEGPLTGSGQVQ
jgi:hypothetical protein